MASSGPAKMTITAYSDPGFTTKVMGAPNPFTVWINPSSYTYGRQISYNDRQAQGSPEPSPEFNRIADEDISFDLVFDATGVIPPPTGQSYKNGVADILNQFINLVATVNGAIHSPNYLIVGWATLQFQCVLSSLKIDYTLFMPDGTPLRAKVSVSFKSYTSESAIAKGAAKASPDLSHIVTVAAGDTLPDLCYRVYGDSGYYAEVARINGLLSFRALAPGLGLLFPPLRGSAS
jgi:hypothetical protein